MKCINFYFYFIFLIESTRGFLVKPRILPRIIGGEDATIKDFPYQASLRLRGEHGCGGTIISNRHVLTAAHCMNSYFTAPFASVSVSTGTSSSVETGNSHRIAKVTIHPRWIGTQDSSYVYDIAVVKLAGEIIFNQHQQKIKLASQDVFSGMEGYLSGWGKITPNKNSKHSVQLQKLKMMILNSTDCQPTQRLKIHENQFCAFHESRYGACFGDSGGPLVFRNEIVGVVSFINDKTCATGVPEVYTNVYHHRAFIESEMRK